MIALALALAQTSQSPVLGVYRCAFEDRSRMVIIELKDKRWIAFNPRSCSVQKIWRGEMDWRGKVYDFSQNNCRAKGKTEFELPSEIWRQTAEWTADGVERSGDGLLFAKDGALIMTPWLNVAEFQDIYVCFDEASRAAPVRVGVMQADDSWGDTFTSTMHGHSDTDWQWNYKMIATASPKIQIQWHSPLASSRKKLRNARVFGDYQIWANDSKWNMRKWRGYELTKEGVILRFDVTTGKQTIQVEHLIGENHVLSISGDLGAFFLRPPEGSGMTIPDHSGRRTSLSPKMFLMFGGS